MKLFAVIIFGFLLVVMDSCKANRTEFSLSYSLECVDNYKVVISVSSDKHYVLEEYNYFFDNFEKKREPIIKQGVLDKGEFRKISQLIRQSNIFDLPDYYESHHKIDKGNFLYQLSFKAGGSEKYVFLREINPDQLPEPFFRLLQDMTKLSAGLK